MTKAEQWLSGEYQRLFLKKNALVLMVCLKKAGDQSTLIYFKSSQLKKETERLQCLCHREYDHSVPVVVQAQEQMWIEKADMSLKD